MTAIIGRNGKARLIGPQHIYIIYIQVLNIIGRFRTDLKEIAVGISYDIPHHVMARRTGKAQ